MTTDVQSFESLFHALTSPLLLLVCTACHCIYVSSATLVAISNDFLTLMLNPLSNICFLPSILFTNRRSILISTGASDCSTCPLGYWSSSASSKCSPCAKGRFAISTPISNDGCLPCPLGYYGYKTASSSVASCVACPEGTSTEAEGTAVEEINGAMVCSKCPQGKYSSNGNATLSIGGACTSCPDGTSTVTSGTIGTNSTACSTCDRGYSMHMNITTTIIGNTTSTVTTPICTLCSEDSPYSVIGNYNSSVSSMSCMSWDHCSNQNGFNEMFPKGYIIIPSHISVLPDEAFLSCKSAAFAVIFPADSELVDVGTAFKNSYLQSVSLPKSLKYLDLYNSFQTTTFLTSIGFSCFSQIMLQDVKSSDNAQTALEKLKFLSITPSSVYDGPLPVVPLSCCASGKYSVTGDTSSFCYDCEPGKFTSSLGSKVCQKCPSGSYGSEGTALCSLCPAGKFSLEGGTSCDACDDGQISSTGSSSCSICPSGSYASEGKSLCTLCPAGTYQPIEGAANFKSCKIAEKGTFSPFQGSDSASNCTAGTYSPNKGSTDCFLCPSGKYSDEGSTSCEACNDGEFSSAGSSICEPCGGDK